MYFYNVVVKEYNSRHILHNARKESLMKNKRLFGVLSLLFATGLILTACNKKTNSTTSSENTSSDDSSSSSVEPLITHTVRFFSLGELLETKEVVEGELAEYTGATPTKQPDDDAFKYRFKSWDKDIKKPIMEDTDFNATFSGYTPEIKVGDFEDVSSSSQLKNMGWYALGYGSSGWTKETTAAVSLGKKPRSGAKSLRFDAKEDDKDYKIARDFAPEELNKSVNALKFSLMVPRMNTVKVLLQGTVTREGQTMAAYFSYVVNVPSNEYVDYVIPMNSPGWMLWGEQGKSIASTAEWTGIHQDDVVLYLTSIEFYFRGKDGVGGQNFIAFLDDVSFVTIDNPQHEMGETFCELGDFPRYTGYTKSGHVVRIDVAAGGAATASILDTETPVNINGNVTQEGSNISFKSSDNGQTLTYNGKLSDGGQSIEYISSSSNDPSTAEEISGMTFGAVQVLDNFDQYTVDGISYYEGNQDIENRSGCRGAYYSEYSGGGFSDWTGSGWCLMKGDGSQLKLKTGEGHSGTQSLSLKSSKTNQMKYLQWDIFDKQAAQTKAYRGSFFSFWMKASSQVKVRATIYTKPNPIGSDSNNNLNSFSLAFIEDSHFGEWVHYELPISPKLTYYGFEFYLKPNSVSDTYIYIDDVEIYSANPYATYEAPLPPAALSVPTGMTYYGTDTNNSDASIEIIDNTHAVLDVPGCGETKNGTYVLSNNQVTFTFEDGYTYVATLSEDTMDLTYVSVTGPDGQLKTALTNLSFRMLDYAENAETYTENGQMYYQDNTYEKYISGARGAYYCDFSNGGSASSPVGSKGWNLMGGNGDQLQLDNSTYVDGKQSLKVKKSSAGHMRYIQWALFKGTAKPHTGYNNFVVYLKNNGEVDIKINIMVYHVQKVEYSTQGESCRSQYIITIPKETTEWTPYVVELDSNKTYYGYALYLFSDWSNNGWLNVDKAYYTNNFSA